MIRSSNGSDGSNGSNGSNLAFRRNGGGNDRPDYPRLWFDASMDDGFRQRNTLSSSSALSLQHKYSRPTSKSKSWWQLSCDTWIVAQQLSLVGFVLARHRIALQQQQQQQQQQQMTTLPATMSEEGSSVWISMAAVAATLWMTWIYAAIANQSHNQTSTTATNRWNNNSTSFLMLRRILDAVLLATLLRMVSAVLNTLTASYSSDTVYALAIAGLLLHWIGCDYDYASGRPSRAEAVNRTTTISSSTSSAAAPPFLGGTMSLNAALFSMTLLASRFETSATTLGQNTSAATSENDYFVFISSCVIIFAFFPATRHAVLSRQRRDREQEQSSSLTAYRMIVSVTTLALATATLVLLQSRREQVLWISVLGTITIVAPTWKYFAQRYQRKLQGPWDIVHIQTVDVVVAEGVERVEEEEPSQPQSHEPYQDNGDSGSPETALPNNQRSAQDENTTAVVARTTAGANDQAPSSSSPAVVIRI